MTTYTAYFRTDADFAEHDFDADTPERALAEARMFFDQHGDDLVFESYIDGPPVNEIEISGPDGNDLAVWRNEDLRLRLASRDLLDALEAQTEAAQAVIDAWAQGDLAGAVRTLDSSIQTARAAIATAKPSDV